MQQRRFWSLCLACVVLAVTGLMFGPLQAQESDAVLDLERTGPLWAYAHPAPAQPGDTHVPQTLVRDPSKRPNETMEEVTKVWTMPGSDLKLTRLDLRSLDLKKTDWFPGDHPPMPDIMSIGPKSLGEVGWSCGLCHLPNGKGRPENAPPAGQPVAYTMQQLRDFADGLRYTSDPRKSNTHTMIRLTKAMTEEEMLESAEYFAAIPWTPWMRVIETDVVPEMELHENDMFITLGTERTVPIAGRIIETPENDLFANYLRGSRSGWNVYVPMGSLAKGKELVTTGAGKTVACGVCHGPDLMGLGSMPGIAGRSPSYMMRQLWDMRQGTRKGPQAALMMPVIEKLTVEDMTNIVAYLASLMPLPGPVAPPTQRPLPAP
jgi:cytochrome c553